MCSVGIFELCGLSYNGPHLGDNQTSKSPDTKMPFSTLQFRNFDFSEEDELSLPPKFEELTMLKKEETSPSKVYAIKVG